MKGQAALKSLHIGDRIHLDNDCHTPWKVVSDHFVNMVGVRYREILNGRYGKCFVDEYDEFHLASQCPHSHISSPLTTNRSFYKPPVKLQAR